MKPYNSIFKESGGSLIANSKSEAMGLVSISNLQWEVEKDNYYWTWDEAKGIEKDELKYGWRLPTIQELWSVFNFKKRVKGFEKFKPDAYWSSTIYNDDMVWCIYFGSGNIGYESKRSTCRVRLVREK